MSGKYERTFRVSVSIDRAWRACTDPDELAQWFFPPRQIEADEAHFELFGTDVAWKILEVDAPNRLRYTQGPGAIPPLPGPIETCMVFEADGAGTRITITHSGFGDGEDWATSLESITCGADESVADLILYLETGVGIARHAMERSFHGVQAREVPAGLMVHKVVPQTWGAELGLEHGDLLVEVEGAPVFGYRELWTVACRTEPGTEVSAKWIRDRVLMHGTATLGARPASMAVTG